MSAARRPPRVGITTKQGGSATEKGRMYAAAVEAAGGEVVWLEPDTVAGTDPAEILQDIDGLVLSGGLDPDPRLYGEEQIQDAGVEVDAAHDAAELPLVRAALDRDVPILGICRGIQIMNVAAGGSLHQDLGLIGVSPEAHEQDRAGKGLRDLAHPVQIEPGSRLGELLGTTRAEVNSFHHQSVKRPAEGFVVSARSPEGVVEALEHPGRRFVVAVQWHPERMVEQHPPQRRLFDALLAAARSARAKSVR